MLKQLRLDVRRLDRIVERVRVRKDQTGHREPLEHVVVVKAIFRQTEEALRTRVKENKKDR